MILEIATLHVRDRHSGEFEVAFARAQAIIASAPGYLGHELHRCLEVPGKYVLLVRWRSVQDHEQGFRGSPRYREWKQLLHGFYEPFPRVEHFEPVALAANPGPPGA